MPKVSLLLACISSQDSYDSAYAYMQLEAKSNTGTLILA
jgi:hypothetical protein